MCAFLQTKHLISPVTAKAFDLEKNLFVLELDLRLLSWLVLITLDDSTASNIRNLDCKKSIKLLTAGTSIFDELVFHSRTVLESNFDVIKCSSKAPQSSGFCPRKLRAFKWPVRVSTNLRNCDDDSFFISSRSNSDCIWTCSHTALSDTYRQHCLV